MSIDCPWSIYSTLLALTFYIPFKTRHSLLSAGNRSATILILMFSIWQFNMMSLKGGNTSVNSLCAEELMVVWKNTHWLEKCVLTPQKIHPGVCTECVWCELQTGRYEAVREAACIIGAEVPQHKEATGDSPEHFWQSLLESSFICELMSVSSPLVSSFYAANTVCSVYGRWGGRTTCPPVFSVFFPLISLHSTKMSPFSNSSTTSSNWRELLWVHFNVLLSYLQKMVEAVTFLCDAGRRCTVCELRSCLLLVNSTVAVVYFANWRCS